MYDNTLWVDVFVLTDVICVLFDPVLEGLEEGGDLLVLDWHHCHLSAFEGLANSKLKVDFVVSYLESLGN